MNKYSLINVIGEGTYGRVFKAKHNDTGQIVAIKKFKESDDDEHVRKTALREIRILKQLKHDNVVNLIEVFREKAKIFLVFEHVEKTLLQVLEENPNGLPPLETKRIMWQLLKSIAFIHSHKIIHRDIKPENLLLSKHGVLKICDFGFARLLSGPESIYTDYVSTRWYRAPELLVGDVHYGKAVDVWAIGCQIVEFLTGYPLFPGESDIHTLYYIMKTLGDSLTEQQRQAFHGNSLFHGVKLPEVRDLESLQMKYPNFEPQTIDFIKKCLELDPTKRMNCDQLQEHPYFDQIRDTIEKQLKESVRRDEAQFHFKSIKNMAPKKAAPATEDSLFTATGGDPVFSDQLYKKGWHTSRDGGLKDPAKPSFGQQQEAVFGYSKVGGPPAPMFGGASEVSQKLPSFQTGGGVNLASKMEEQKQIPFDQKSVDFYGASFPQLYGTSSSSAPFGFMSEISGNGESQRAEFKFKQLLNNLCTSGRFVLGQENQLIEKGQVDKIDSALDNAGGRKIKFKAVRYANH